MIDFDDDEQERDDDDNLIDCIHDDNLPCIKKKSTSTNTRLMVSFEGTEDENEPFEFQTEILNYVRENLTSILNAIYEFVYQEREPLEELYGSFNKKSYEGFPSLTSPDEVRNYISLDTLIISEENKNGITFFGFTGNNTWDSEHGLGITMHKDKILKFGDWDDGRYPHYNGDVENAKPSIIDTYMTGTPVTHILDTLATETVSKSEEEALLDLFDFLVKNKAIYGLRSTNLNLSDTDKIKLLQHTKSWSLRDKSIKKIPKAFSLLKNVERLDFSFNKISKIPDSFSNLNKVVSLEISFNKFKEIPEVIFELDTLEYLDFSNNKIKKIPESIENLKGLMYLMISDNKIKELPQSLLETKTLKQFYAANNSFSKSERKKIKKKLKHISTFYV